jgi:oligoendopeptidase F
LAAAVWDLEPLVDGGGPDRARALLDDAAQRAGDFAADYGGRVLGLDGSELKVAVERLAAIRETMLRAFIYAELVHWRDLADASAGALFASVAQQRSEIEQVVRFFELEWGAVSKDAMEQLLAEGGPGVAFAAHHLRRIHEAASEKLSVTEERILSETSATSRLAWTRLAEELTSAVRFEVDGEEVGVGAILSLREDPDRALRSRAQEAFVAALEPVWAPARLFITRCCRGTRRSTGCAGEVIGSMRTTGTTRFRARRCRRWLMRLSRATTLPIAGIG